MSLISNDTQLKVLTERVLELYLIHHDYIGMMGFMDNDMCWIGMDETTSLIVKDDLFKYFQNQKLKKYSSIHITDFQTQEISKDSVIAIVMLEKLTKCHKIEKDKYTFIWLKNNQLWKIKYIHHSSLTQINHSKKETINYEKRQFNKIFNIDSLTHIFNMKGLIEDIERLLHSHFNTDYVLIKFGIRNFRYINRSHGYDLGDQVLKNIAQNLLSTCQNDETCGRIEKDIFAMLYKFTGKKDLEKRLIELKRKLVDKELSEQLGISFEYAAGIYVVDRSQSESVLCMLDKALIAKQYVSQNHIGSQFVYYDDVMMQNQLQQSQLLESIIPAMKNHEFKLYLQPQFDIHTKEVVSSEALCRWIKTDGVIIQPCDFIPLLEKYGFIIEFDFYMLDILCQWLRKCLDEGKIIKPVSINQSRLHLEHNDYLKKFCKTVDRYHIPHQYITFELTESTFIEHQTGILKLAVRLNKLGFMLAIDDFGTGYASLNILSSLSADILKIDKSLLNHIEDNSKARSIMQKIIELAHDIDMTVICEGIEKENQLIFLREMNCDIGQGYLVEKPISALQFENKYL